MGETLTIEPKDVRRRARQQRLRRQRLLVAAAVVAVVGLGIGLGLTVGGSSSGHSQPPGLRPVIVSARGLRTLANVVPDPIYWAGVIPGKRYELSRTPDGKVFVRYLPLGVPAGSKTPYLTVATYPYPNALRAIRGLANSAGVRSIPLPRGGLAIVDSSRATNIHLAYPKSAYEVEVFAPTAAQARRVVTSGKVRSVALSRR
jgi:hypothetical protein